MLWDPNSATFLGSFEGTAQRSVFSLSFSPDHKTLASGHLNGLMLWDVATRKPRGEISVEGKGVFSLAFSMDGRVLAIGGGDGKVSLWDVPSGHQLGPDLPGHSSEIEQLRFSSDGKSLASVGRDGTVLLWETNVARWREAACEMVNRNLRPAEWQAYLGDSMKYTEPVCASR